MPYCMRRAAAASCTQKEQRLSSWVVLMGLGVHCVPAWLRCSDVCVYVCVLCGRGLESLHP